ncbi:unnamed protein product [Prunus armeniaca]|uniref:KIB1-4 beta-propeller domain-containing protein n=1 Tax=Prunus armeniaca TaxID=36596 RepID=A0A6J5VFN3_PRUAR|nr:unnamed protein product [Prunus armeniaca]
MASRIPDELWESIGKCLNTKTDVSRFRAVCKSWRSSLPLFSKQFPLQFPIQVVTKKCSLSFTLNESVICHLAPPAATGYPRERGWLICVKEGEKGETHHMLHPLSQSTVLQLPYSYPKLLNLLEYRVSEVAKVYVPRFRDDCWFCGKAALSLNLDFPAVMMVIRGMLWYGKLGVDRKKCIQVSPLTRERSIYEDVIFYQGKFCAVCYNGTAVEVDSSLDMMMIASPIKGRFTLNYLVESSGEVLLVRLSGEDSYSSCNSSGEDSDSSDEESDSSYQELSLAPAPAEVTHEGGFSSGANYRDSLVLGELVLALPQVPAPAELAKPAHDEDSSYEGLPQAPAPAEVVHPAHDEDSDSSSGSSVKVYKLNADEKQWVEVEAEALRDRILGVGSDHCFSVSTGDFPGCRGGCIYFYNLENRTIALGRGSMLSQTAVFCLDSGTWLPLTDYPSFQNIFCPPPTWTWFPTCQANNKGKVNNKTWTWTWT